MYLIASSKNTLLVPNYTGSIVEVHGYEPHAHQVTRKHSEFEGGKNCQTTLSYNPLQRYRNGHLDSTTHACRSK